MNSKQLVKLSKRLSKVLRHAPESIGITLDKNGWVEVQELLKCLGSNVSIDNIRYVVANNNKKRFEFSPDQSKIRACQGHSINIDLDLKSIDPPDILYHGTAEKTVPYIQYDGILKMNRDHVHLSKDYETATNVGGRHGKPIVLSIDAKKMHEHGMKFYVSNNGVWLTDFVPKEYITFEK
jgi:putative RNA 2'-phosphotransferase